LAGAICYFKSCPPPLCPPSFSRFVIHFPICEQVSKYIYLKHFFLFSEK
jgi:hypothetical protein